MDPSIVKLLEDDEDETMHSGADVEAFQAALNRDIGGDASNSHLSDSDAGIHYFKFFCLLDKFLITFIHSGIMIASFFFIFLRKQ
jgi:hypothetical protein